jgi:hypothetical protein
MRTTATGGRCPRRARSWESTWDSRSGARRLRSASWSGIAALCDCAWGALAPRIGGASCRSSSRAYGCHSRRRLTALLRTACSASTATAPQRRSCLKTSSRSGASLRRRTPRLDESCTSTPPNSPSFFWTRNPRARAGSPRRTIISPFTRRPSSRRFQASSWRRCCPSRPYRDSSGTHRIGIGRRASTMDASRCCSTASCLGGSSRLDSRRIAIATIAPPSCAP